MGIAKITMSQNDASLITSLILAFLKTSQSGDLTARDDGYQSAYRYRFISEPS